MVITPGKLLIEMEFMSTQFDKNIKSSHYLRSRICCKLHERTLVTLQADFLREIPTFLTPELPAADLMWKHLDGASTALRIHDNRGETNEYVRV